MCKSTRNSLVKTEKLKHKEAFEFYYALGDNRTLQKVADEFKVNYLTIMKWRDSFDWMNRIQERDNEIANKIKEETMNSLINEKKNYRKIVKLAITQIVGKMKNGELKYNITDLDRLVRLDLHLLGEEEQSVKVNSEVTLTEQDKDMISTLSSKFGLYVDELGEA